jgi:hypothetical protein
MTPSFTQAVGVLIKLRESELDRLRLEAAGIAARLRTAREQCETLEAAIDAACNQSVIAPGADLRLALALGHGRRAYLRALGEERSQAESRRDAVAAEAAEMARRIDTKRIEVRRLERFLARRRVPLERSVQRQALRLADEAWLLTRPTPRSVWATPQESAGSP